MGIRVLTAELVLAVFLPFGRQYLPHKPRGWTASTEPTPQLEAQLGFCWHRSDRYSEHGR